MSYTPVCNSILRHGRARQPRPAGGPSSTSAVSARGGGPTGSQRQRPRDPGAPPGQHHTPTSRLTHFAQEAAAGGAAVLRSASAAVRRLALFSRNETADDVATGSLKYLLVPSLLGELLAKAAAEDRPAAVDGASPGAPWRLLLTHPRQSRRESWTTSWRSAKRMVCCRHVPCSVRCQQRR